MGTMLSLQKGTKEWVKLSKDDQDRYRKEVSFFMFSENVSKNVFLISPKIGGSMMRSTVKAILKWRIQVIDRGCFYSKIVNLF